MATVDQHEIEGRPRQPGQHLVRPADLERHSVRIASLPEVRAAGIDLRGVLDDADVLGGPLREQDSRNAAPRFECPAPFLGERSSNELVAGSVRAEDPFGRPVVHLGRIGEDSFDVRLAPAHRAQGI